MEKSETQQKIPKRKAATRIITAFILVTVVVSAITVTFLHEYQPASSAELTLHKKEYKKIISKRDDGLALALANLQKGDLLVPEYVAQYSTIIATSKTELDSYHTIKKSLISRDSVIGYSSMKNFLLGIGLPIFSLVVCLFYFQIVIKSNMHNLKKNFYTIVGGAFLMCATYWVSWSFVFTTNTQGDYDFEHYIYDIALYGIPLIVVAGSYFIFKYYTSIEEKMKAMISILFKGFYEDLENENLISPDKDEEFRRLRMDITEKVVEHE